MNEIARGHFSESLITLFLAVKATNFDLKKTVIIH